MELDEKSVIELLTDHLQPKIRVDGGDARFEKQEGDVIYLGAHAECATCPAATECLKWWCEQEFRKAFGTACTVVINKHVPYYER